MENNQCSACGQKFERGLIYQLIEVNPHHVP